MVFICRPKVILMLLVVISTAAYASTPTPQQAAIRRLFSDVAASQIKTAVKYAPFWSDEQMKGIIPSYIHINFHGDEGMALLRNDIVKFFDNNFFVTTWTMNVLIEAHAIGAIDLNSGDGQKLLRDGIDAAMTFRDHTFPTGTPVFDFWPQEIDQFGKWEQFPVNIGNTLQNFESIGAYISQLLHRLGLDWLAHQIDWLINSGDSLLSAFRTQQRTVWRLIVPDDSYIDIPADFDDTGVNLALGTNLKNHFPGMYSKWTGVNFNFDNLATIWNQYSYKPFSTNQLENGIDPRTYFWIRGFLDEEFAAGTKKLALMPTWAMNVDEDIANFYDGDKMPFNANNIDASVAANGVYGLTMAALFPPGNVTISPPSWFTQDLRSMYADTGRLLAWFGFFWTLRANIMNWRPDLALLYYPPTFDFYWFVARSVFQLSAIPQAQMPFPEMTKTRDILTNAMEVYGTDQILALATFVNQGADMYYWDDFLGDNDVGFFGQKLVRGEDRIFSTSVAINALIDTWSTYSPNCSRLWKPTAPVKVKQVVTGGVAWLLENMFTGKYLFENAFFSGSMKGMHQGPWFFPANRIEYFNGTKIPPNSPQFISGNIIDLVQGYIPKAQYDKWLGQQWFGVNVPASFDGYNAPNEFFPYWSAPSFTKSVALLALAKHDKLAQHC